MTPRTIRPVNPLAAQCLANEQQRRVKQVARERRPPMRTYKIDPWNRLSDKLELHLCNSVREALGWND
jgi:hypothetical protein